MVNFTAKAGTRAKVFALDSGELIGTGTFMGTITVREAIMNPDGNCYFKNSSDVERAEKELILTAPDDTTAKIVLDNGQTVYGFQCFCDVVPESRNIN